VTVCRALTAGPRGAVRSRSSLRRVRGSTKINSLIYRWRPSAPRPGPPLLPSFTHQSSWPAADHVAVFTWIGGSTSRRSASACWVHVSVA